MTEHTMVYTLNNILETRNKIEELERQGYGKEKLFVLTQPQIYFAPRGMSCGLS